MAQRVGGLQSVTIDGERFDAKGAWTWSLGRPLREAVLGPSAIQGYKESAGTPMCEGAITVRTGTDVQALLDKSDATIVLELGGHRVFSLHDAWQNGEGSVSTEEGELGLKFEGMTANLD